MSAIGPTLYVVPAPRAGVAAKTRAIPPRTATLAIRLRLIPFPPRFANPVKATPVWGSSHAQRSGPIS